MKHIYSWTIVALACIAAFVPQNTNAQCTCTGGVPAVEVKNVAVLSPTNLPSATITVPKFDPASYPGYDLSCVWMYDTLTGITTSGARNLNSSTALLPTSDPLYSPTGRMKYRFILPITANVVGPGIDQSNDWTTPYGPDSLGAYGQPDDTITYGPTNVFTGFVDAQKSTNPSAYIGTGNVSLSYTILGNLIATQGSINFAQKVTAVYYGNFGISYYLCPSAPLARSITNFSAFKKDNQVQLQWLAANYQNNSIYEIQYSKNSEDYFTIGSVPSGAAAAGTITQYQYQYHINQTDVGELYFRIKRTDTDGKISYSAIKVVNLNGADHRPGIQTYPNPVVNTVNIQFDEQQSGNFMMELVNMTGQVIQQKAVILSGHSFTSFTLNSHPPKGVYFLRAKDISHNKLYITKVVVE